jgi:hypothetical protein
LPLSAFGRGRESRCQDGNYRRDGKGVGAHILLSSNTVASAVSLISPKTRAIMPGSALVS